MRKDDYDDIDLFDDDLPLVEIELDEDGEDGGGSRTGLKVVFVILLLCIALVAGFFVARHFLDGRNSTTVVLPAPTAEQQSSTAGSADSGNVQSGGSTGTENNDGQAAMEATPIPTPAHTPTPTPAPTPTPTPSIPEEYKIAGVEPGDLDAVRTYIQEQLNAMAADPTFPNVDEITVNDDCTVFTAICNSLNESVAEREAVATFFHFSSIYATYAGTTVDSIHIDYRNRLGDLLWTRDFIQSSQG